MIKVILRLTATFACGLMLAPVALAQRQFTITGQVFDKSGQVISGIPITIQRGEAVIRSTVSGPNGKYSVSFSEGSTLTAVAYLGNEFTPNVIYNLSGSTNHTINKVLSRTAELAQLTTGETLEAMNAMEFLKKNRLLYGSTIDGYERSIDSQQLAANLNSAGGAVNERVSAQDEYDVKTTMQISFRSGSDNLSPEAKAQLDRLIEEATKTRSYVIEISGFGDPVASTDRNFKLAQQRKDELIGYLTNEGKIPLRRIITPFGYEPMVNTLDVPKPHIVTVKLLVSTGIAQP